VDTRHSTVGANRGTMSVISYLVPVQADAEN